ncbi:MAG: DUF4847 family protein [Prevotellaceae bacterium]|nr:DUF4847 family protein [Prevotellaceae bacterium]
MKIVVKVSLVLSILLSFTSCTMEDDIEEIFVGKIWYMDGATINGMRLNSEIKNFYTEVGENAYYISFSTDTFQGVLSSGVTFAGKWSADGKKQTVQFEITTTPNTTSTFDKQIYNIISAPSSYSSGADFLHLSKDDNNMLYLSASRSKVYN